MATFASIELLKKLNEDEDLEGTSTSDGEKVLGIEKSGPKRIVTKEVSSIFNLKNELLKKQSKLQKTNLKGATHISGKSNLLTTKKEEKEAAEKEAEERRKRINQNERKMRCEQEIELAQQKLRDKAALYDKLAEGNVVLPENAEFVVDFMAKKREKERKYEEEEACSSYSSMTKKPTRAPTPERYHHSEEQRVFGVSHMRFSKDEEKRKEEIQNLLDYSKQVKEDSRKNMEKKGELEEKRLKKINALRIKKGLEPIKPPTPPPQPSINLDDIPIPPEQQHETPEQRHLRLMKSSREWDRGKGLYTQWIEKQRDDRNDEFRPPDVY